MAWLGCGTHRAFVYARGGVTLLGELKKPSDVWWQRIRDDISTAQVTVSTDDCCELLNKVKCVLYELHIMRDDLIVWQGPITRIEWGRDTTSLFAQDIMWVPFHTAHEKGYNYSYPNLKYAGQVMTWDLYDWCFAKYGNPWRVFSSNINWKRGRSGDDPKTTRAVAAWSRTIWEDVDSFAEDGGMDYTVVNRSIYFWDTHLQWKVLADLTMDNVSGWPTVVEYGSELATRSVYTNGTGLTSVRTAPAAFIAQYGYVDVVNTATAENAGQENASNQETLDALYALAGRSMAHRYPPPTRIRLPEGTQLLPSTPWQINDMIPGAWVHLKVQGQMCHDVTEWHKLDVVSVREQQETGEVVTISTTSAPLEVEYP